MTHDPQLNQATKDADVSTLWNDSYIAYIPLLGAAVALIYDVGCFYAIEINFFTLFSLSEHIVFAIQAFPIALTVLIPISGLTVVMGKGASYPPSDPKKTSKRQRIAAYIFLIILILILVALAGFGIVFISAKSPVMLLVVVEAVILASGVYVVNILYRRVFIIVMSIMIILTLSFAIGFETGRAYLSETYAANIGTPSVAGDVVKLKSGEMISGRIIRSGDRGVLFYDPMPGRLHFLLWVAIGSIEATPQKTTVGR